MNFVGNAVAKGVSYGITHGVARNVSHAVSKTIKSGSASVSKHTSNTLMSQNVVHNPRETHSQKVVRKLKRCCEKVKTNVKSLVYKTTR